MFKRYRKFIMELQGGKQSKEAERRSETSSPDPVIPKKNDAESQATPPKEQLQTNASSTAVATSPLEAAVHEESQAQDKGQVYIYIYISSRASEWNLQLFRE